VVRYKTIHDLLLKLGPRRYPGAWFRLPTEEKIIYLTFDDGPTPEVTHFVLETLQLFKAKASFFLIGKNVEQYPEIVNRIRSLGHTVGAHCMNHENGMKTDDSTYLKSAEDSVDLLKDTLLFRPPYGRLRKRQHQELVGKGFQVVFWDVLTYDYDTELSASECIELSKSSVKPGSIVVFHDSRKAADRLFKALPSLLKYWHAEGYRFEALPKE